MAGAIVTGAVYSLLEISEKKLLDEEVQCQQSQLSKKSQRKCSKRRSH